MLDEIQEMNMKESRLKIPILYAIDAVHGADYTLGSTIFPHNLGLAASRNTALVKLTAQITAKEVRATGIRYNFSPVLDAGRQVLWPRLAETFGEDINLVKKMGLASIEGCEGSDLKSVNQVAACMKHFIGYSFPTSGKDRSSALIPDITLREFFLPSFSAAVNASVKTVMVNSAEVNGIPVHSNKYLLSGIILAYWAGEKGANAIADVLFGDYKPSVKLPITYPKYPNSLITYDHKYLDEVFESASPQIYSEEFNPQYQFGFGLSYTQFDYSNISFSSPTLKVNQTINIKVTVTNSGKMAGKEPVELYSSDLIASIAPSVKRLRDFTKIYLEPGQSKEVTFKISTKDLAFVGKDLKWITEPGDFNITIGNQKKNLVYVNQ